MRWTAINYFSIPVAAIAGMLLGFVWYSPLLFGPAWAKCRGIDMHDPKQSQELQKGMGGIYAASFAATLLSATALCLLVVRVQSGGVLGGIKLGILVWLGFTMTVQLTSALFSHKNKTLFFIDTGYQLVCFLAMGAILGGWQ
jgi:hypothetical protein